MSPKSFTTRKARADYFRIGFPIYGKGSQRFIGAASALIDVSSLFSRLTQAQSAAPHERLW